MSSKEPSLKILDLNANNPQRKLSKILTPSNNYDDYENQYRKCKMNKVKSLESFTPVKGN